MKKFDKIFQEKLARVIVSDRNILHKLSRIRDNIDIESIFDVPVYSWFVSRSLVYFEKYNTCPPREYFSRCIKKNNIPHGEKRFYWKFYKRLKKPVKNKNYYVDELFAFLKYKIIERSISLSIDELNNGNIDRVVDRIMESVDKTKIVEDDIGLVFFEEYKKRLNDVEVDAGIKTGITSFDRLFKNNGITKRKLFVIAAPPGKGKTSWLVDKGYKAILQGKSVLFITLEMSEQEIFERFLASFSGVPLFNIAKKKKLVRKRVGGFPKRFRNRLIIKEFSSLSLTVNGLSRYIDRLNSELGFYPDLVLIDYADLMKPTKWLKDKREALSSIYTGLKKLAQDKEVAIWTASQVGRKALWSKIIDIDTLWEDFGKAMIADSIVALCMKKKERENSRARLYVAKNRDGIDGVEVPVKVDYSTQRFYSLREN